MVEHGSTASKILLCSKHVITDNESSSSEGASEGYANENDGYNVDKELPMYDQEGGESSKQSQHGMHIHTCDHSHYETKLIQTVVSRMEYIFQTRPLCSKEVPEILSAKFLPVVHHQVP